MAGNGASPTISKRRLGRALMELRETVGVTQDDAARVLECSPAKIRRIEVGDVAIRAAELTVLLDHYGASKQARRPIEQLAREARKRRPRTTYGTVLPAFFRRFFDLEQIATETLRYQAELVPGPLQTADYARALLTANPGHRPEDLDRLVEARMSRRTRIADGEQRLHAVLHETALRTAVGGPEVMRAQLLHLRKLAGLPNVTLQVVPLGAPAHPLSGHPFVLLRFPDDRAPVVYLEGLTTANTVDEPGHVARYEEAFGRVAATALTPAKSSTLLATLAGNERGAPA